MPPLKQFFKTCLPVGRFLLILLLSFGGVKSSLYAQLNGQAKIDSLVKELPKQKEDTNRVNLLDKISMSCSVINPDEGIKYGYLELALSEKLAWKKGTAKAADNLASNYISKSNYFKAIEYDSIALKISEGIDNKTLTANINTNIAVAYQSMGYLPHALEYYFSALNIYENEGDRTGIAGITGNLGNVYSMLSDYPKALEYYFKSLKINEAIGNKSEVAGLMCNIGNIYYIQKDYFKALDYFLKALKIDEEQGNKFEIAGVTGNIGIVYSDKGDYPKALEYYFKSLKLNEELGDKGGIAIVNGNIGNTYYRQHMYPIAIEYENRALKIALEINDKHNAACQLEFIGEVFLSLITDTVSNLRLSASKNEVPLLQYKPTQEIPVGRHQRIQKALDYLEQGLALSKEIQASDLMMKCYEHLATLYKMKGDFKNSLGCKDNYQAIKDSIYSKDNIDKISKITTKYELEKKIADDEKKILSTAIKNKEQQQLLYKFIIGVLSVIITLAVIMNRYRPIITLMATNKYDTPEIVVRKMSIVIISIATCFAAIVWAFLYYYYYGLSLPTYGPVIYFVAVAPSVAIFFMFKKEHLLVNVQLFCIFVMPVMMEWTSGGFKSGVVIDWALLAPVGALMYKGMRTAALWMILFVATVICTLVFNDYFSSLNSVNSNAGQALFYGMNIIGPATVIYFSMQYYVKSVIRDGQMLQASNMTLTSTLGELQIEKQKSDNLLLNILPDEIAQELKANGSAEAKLIDEVTVLFTDFKGFTQLTEKMSPKALVAEINECFSGFDLIMQKYGVEKIKTIGDSYMAAGGLPTANKTHPEDIVNAALAIRQYMVEHKTKKQASGELFFEIRIGVHTGPVVAGIVGIKKFQYDIWGDTVNTASRMESSGEVGKVNISGTTYELIKGKFTCQYRGKVAAKGKGEVDMYFVV